MADFCESCHDAFTKGELKHTNTQNKGVSPKLEDHAFATYVDPAAFSPKGQERVPIVKGPKVGVCRPELKVAPSFVCVCVCVCVCVFSPASSSIVFFPFSV